MDETTIQALETLLDTAERDTGGSAVCRNFLLAWWNAADLGGFDLTQAWGLDLKHSQALISVFTYIALNNEYPPREYAPRFEALAAQRLRAQEEKGRAA